MAHDSRWVIERGGGALASPAVRLAACRGDADDVVVRTQRGRARLIESLGVDPLGLGGYVELDDRDLLSRTRETDMPEAPRQLLQLFQSSRAGHGSLIAEHMEVPIAASVALPDAPIRRVDLMPTILERLDVTVPSGVVLDGVPFSKIVAPTEPLAR